MTSQVMTQRERGIHIVPQVREIEVTDDWIQHLQVITGANLVRDEDGSFWFPEKDPEGPSGVINRIPHMQPGDPQLTTQQAEDAFNRQRDLARERPQMTADQRWQLLLELLDGNA